MNSSTKPSSITSNSAGVSLRPVNDADQEFLIGVYANTRAAELAQVDWDESQKDAFIRWQYAMQKQEYEARYPSARYDIILVDGARPVGFGSELMTRRSGCLISRFSRNFKIEELEHICCGS